MSNQRAPLVAPPPHSPLIQPPERPEFGRARVLSPLSGCFNQRLIRRDGDISDTKPPPSPETNLRVNLDIEQAMTYVLAHTNINSLLVFLGRDPSDSIIHEPLGNFKFVDNLDEIKVSANKSESLWRLEAERLVSGINNVDNNVLFPEACIPDGDYSLLASLAKEMGFLVSISQVSNRSSFKQELPELVNENNFQHVCYHLRHEIASAIGKKNKNNSDKAREGQHTLSQEHTRKSIFALIDYITLVLGRILIHSAPQNATWCYICLSSLVKYTTKLKVLTKDTVRFATETLSTAEDITMLSQNTDNDQRDTRVGAAAGLLARLNQQNIDKTTTETSIQTYNRLNLVIRKKLESFVISVLNNLGRPVIKDTPRASFEICSVVYESGLERFRTWVYQERDGDLQATACQKTIPMARPAFQLLQNTVRALKADQQKRGRPPPTTASNLSPSEGTHQPLRTHLHWDEISSDSIASSGITDDYSHAHSLEIRTITEAITIMVPLLLVSPFVLTDLPELIQKVTNVGSKLSVAEDSVLPTHAGKFKAFFSLFTDSQIDVNERIRPLNASSLSRGLMTRDRLLRGTKLTEIHGRSFSRADHFNLRRRQVDLALEMDRGSREMDKWIFEETAVLVGCKVYVWTTITFATLLAICGVVVGFTVRGRVEAVDPFNITTYCWVLAAFGVLVAKSIRVEAWPWRDFLHGHVRCRSVTELHSVTRIHEDFILCKLLDAEETSILQTRGPYNAAFKRKHDSGFSIDRPLSMWTMLLSGLIMVKVDTDQGPTLVCLEVRRGTEYVSVRHSEHGNARGEGEEELICTNLTRPDSMLPLKRQVVDWNRVVGLYSNRTARFV